MRKFLIVALALALTGGVAYANYCARDYVPAATLLVPFGIVDLNDNYAPDYAGYTTLLTVTNVSSERTLIHITVWNNLSYAIIDFDEVLSGYDVWSINFRDLLEGHFERFDTAVERTGGVVTKTPDYEGFWGPQNLEDVFYDGGSTLGPIPYPWGPFTNCVTNYELDRPEDIDFLYGPSYDPFEGCYFPYGYMPSIGSAVIDELVGYYYMHPFWDCDLAPTPTTGWMTGFDDTQAWFYVTVDAVNFCSRDFPDTWNYWCTLGYFGTPTNKDANILIGDVIWLDTANNFSESMPAVSIETDWSVAPHFPPDSPTYYPWGVYSTFYGDFMWTYMDPGWAPGLQCSTGGPFVWYDSREPMPQAWAIRYINSGGVTSAVRCWKNYHERTYYDTSTTRYRYYYGWRAFLYYAWDENENTKTRGGGPSGFLTKEPHPFPWEVQEVPLTNSNFTALMPGNGWMLFVFEPAIDDPVYEWDYQAWIGVKFMFQGFSTFLEGAVMANPWCFGDQTYEYNWGIGYNYNWE